MENVQMKIPIDAELVNEVLNYLSKKPFGEVNSMINKILAEGRSFEDSKQKELEIDVTD